MIRKILCFLGWHEWRWKLRDYEGLRLSDPVPDSAKCKYCGLRYGVKK